MMPATINGLSAGECISALQKHIRRNEEVEAALCAFELGHTSPNYATWVCNRLVIISHEDIGLADPSVAIYVDMAVRQAGEFRKANKIAEWRMVVGNAIRLMCRAPKSREGDSFQAAIGIPNQYCGKAPVIPDYAYDKHTSKGKALGRGLQHFREVGAKLVPAPSTPDVYEDDAFVAWENEAVYKKDQQDEDNGVRSLFSNEDEECSSRLPARNRRRRH